MQLKIEKNLTKLKDIFTLHQKKLYVVGGFVRDKLLNRSCTDIDLASGATNEELEAWLKNTPFKFKLGSKKLGTSVISVGDKKFEHTTFRTEKYAKGGFHTPKEVEFVKDIYLDAKRRDFTVNALYYDLQAKLVIDFFEGIKDLQKRQIKTTIAPKKIFKQDGLRLLRMIRFAKKLDFSIHKKTFKVAKKSSYQLKDVTGDRIFCEFKLLLEAGSQTPLSKVFAIKALCQIKAFGYIFPALLKLDKKHKKYIMQLADSLDFYLNCSQKHNLQAFLLDFCLFFAKKHAKSPSLVAKELLNDKNCGISNKEKKQALALVKALHCLRSLKTDIEVRWFLQEYCEIYKVLLDLLKNSKQKDLYKNLKTNADYMLKYNIPFKLSELALDGHILLKEFKNLPKKDIGKLLSKGLLFVALDRDNNVTQKIITHLKSEEKQC